MSRAKRLARDVAVMAVLFATLAPTLVKAHGGRPQTYDVVFDPRDPDVIVVPATFGTLLSRDGGASWESLCIHAMPDPRPGTLRSFVVTGTGSILAGQEFGLVRGPEHGCGWGYVSAWPRDAFVADVIAISPDEALVLRSDASVSNQLFRATADGTSLEALAGTFPTDFLPERVRVAPSDMQRVWVSGTARRTGTIELEGRVYLSDDGGSSYTPHVVPLGPEARRLRVLVVDAEDPDRALGVIQAMNEDRVIELRVSAGTLEVRDIVTLDAAAMAVDRPFALALAPDGIAWLGNNVEGLFTLSRGGTLTLVDKLLGVACAVVHGPDLWLCTDGFPDVAGDGFALARQRLDAPYAPVPALRFEDIRGPVTCADPSDAVCGERWPELLLDLGRWREVDGGIGPDSGPIDAGLDPRDAGLDAAGGMPADVAADAGSAVRAGGCACRAAGGGSPGWIVWVALIVGGFAIRRRLAGTGPGLRRRPRPE